MDWINFSPPFSILGSSSGRRKGEAENATSTTVCAPCDACAAKRYFEKVLVAGGILAFISAVRSFCCWAYMRRYPDGAKSAMPVGCKCNTQMRNSDLSEVVFTVLLLACYPFCPLC